MDNILQNLINQESKRQKNEIEMIASENYVSKEVLKACGNVFTNKYSEWYPGKRYYGGQSIVDKNEVICQYRALRIFDLIKDYDDLETKVLDEKADILKDKLDNNAWEVNVQTLSGSPANLAVYLWILQPGDTILAMSLDAWWHLSHWHSLNASWIYYNIEFYGVDKNTYRLDYDDILQKALKYKPKILLAGFSAYPRDVKWNKFKQIQQKVYDKHGYKPVLMADIAHIAWLIAGNQLDWPFNSFDVVTTTTHKTLRWPRGAVIYFNKGLQTDQWWKSKRLEKQINFKKSINRWVFPWLQGWPHQHLILAKSQAFKEILDQDFVEYSKQVLDNAKILAQWLIDKWWRVLTGWTDNHLVLVDVTKKNNKDTWLTGKQAESILEQVGISVNKNMLPYDNRSPLDPSGLRLGTPALTTRGMWLAQVSKIVEIIDEVLVKNVDSSLLEKNKAKIKKLCNEYLIY